MPDYGFFLNRVMQPVSPTTGESGYFSSPESTLDPRLFMGHTFKPIVRQWILNTLYSFWQQRYKNPQRWSTVWVAGSGISYQWAASRGNGDLDILIGVDFGKFFEDNPTFQGLPPKDMAEIFNQEFHSYLWPQTANTQISESGAPNPAGTKDIFEVTFYVNYQSADIRDINPYAAYDLTHNRWTVHPPQGDAFKHAPGFYKQAEGEVQQARGLVDRYNAAAQNAKGLQAGTPGWHNAMRQVDLLAAQAADLYDNIHLGRKMAFAPGGSGYGDYFNFRWQYHKLNGTAQALNQVAHAHKAARDEYNTQMYGGMIEGADLALRRAALWNRGGNGR